MNTTTALTVIEKAIESGQVLKQEIEIDGQRVRFQSLKDQLAYYEWLKAKQVQESGSSPYSRGRIVIGDPGDGLV